MEETLLLGNSFRPVFKILKTKESPQRLNNDILLDWPQTMAHHRVLQPLWNLLIMNSARQCHWGLLLFFFFLLFSPNINRPPVQCISPSAPNISKHILEHLHPLGDLRGKNKNKTKLTHFNKLYNQLSVTINILDPPQQYRLSTATEWKIPHHMKHFPEFHLQIHKLCSKVGQGTLTSRFPSHCRAWINNMVDSVKYSHRKSKNKK